jgi:hypothetical protein
MKVTKTSVHRLTIEKTCGCQATREYEDVRYTKPTGEGVFTACLKHNKGAVAEFAGEMLIEALDKEAESAGKASVAAAHTETVTSLSGTSGGSVTSMGAPNVKPREKRNPLESKTARFERPDLRHPQNTNFGNLNVAQHDDISEEELVEAGITMNGSIDDVPEDPKATAALTRDLNQIEDMLDDDDIREGGVSQTLINRQAVD